MYEGIIGKVQYMKNFMHWFKILMDIIIKKNYIWKVLKKEKSLDNALYGTKNGTINRGNENEA